MRLVVENAGPDRQHELKELATTLADQELIPIGTQDRAARSAAPASLSPLPVGFGLLVIGAGLFFLIPFVGIMLAALGFAGILWGAAMSWTKTGSKSQKKE